LRFADAVGACTDADIDAFAAVFAGVGVLQAFNGQVAGGDVGGIGHHNGATQGQVVAGAAEVADVEAGVDVLGGFAAAACFVITDAGIPAAGAAAAGADTGVAGGLLKTAGLGVGTGTEEDAAGIQRQGAGIDFAANDAGHVCVDRHVRSTE